jgi:hypothetical protein
VAYDPVLLVTAALPEPQQLAQAGQRAAMLQELVPTQLLCRRTALHVHAQTYTQEGFQFFAQLLWLLESGRAVRGNEVQRLQRLLIQVRWLGLNHLDRHDTKRPDVDLVAVLFLLDNFGRHPVRRADHGGALVSLLSKLGTEPKIRDLDRAPRRKKHVVRFDITVDDVLAMQVNEAFAGL